MTDKIILTKFKINRDPQVQEYLGTTQVEKVLITPQELKEKFKDMPLYIQTRIDDFLEIPNPFRTWTIQTELFYYVAVWDNRKLECRDQDPAQFAR